MSLDDFDPAYLVTLDEIYHCYWTARKKRRIGQLRKALEHFWPDGHPARCVHLSGTNGKGSVAHYLVQGLQHAAAAGGTGQAGTLTGSWTGPHVFDYAERLHLGTEPAPHAEIADVYRGTVAPYLETLPEGEALGFPEVGILLALHLFERHGVAWGMMESGVGGRYTPLMALPAAASLVTNVGGDHPLSLGQELWQRALEKAGVARPGVPFFTAATGDAREYVVRAARAEGADVHTIDDDDLAATRDLLGERADALPDPEIANLALAAGLIRHFYPDADPAELLAAMTARLPGRFWQPEPRVIVDVAHNREKIAHLADRLKREFPGQRFRFLLGLTRQRDPIEMFEPLLEIAASLAVTSASYPGRDPADVASQLRRAFQPVAVHQDPCEAYARELDALEEGQHLVLTGSAYMIDQALNPNPYIGHMNATFGWRGKIGEQT